MREFHAKARERHALALQKELIFGPNSFGISHAQG
jgi:hypothetical protein